MAKTEKQRIDAHVLELERLCNAMRERITYIGSYAHRDPYNTRIDCVFLRKHLNDAIALTDKLDAHFQRKSRQNGGR